MCRSGIACRIGSELSPPDALIAERPGVFIDLAVDPDVRFAGSLKSGKANSLTSSRRKSHERGLGATVFGGKVDHENIKLRFR
jgi:hypothetical protein